MKRTLGTPIVAGNDHEHIYIRLLTEIAPRFRAVEDDLLHLVSMVFVEHVQKLRQRGALIGLKIRR